MENNQVDRRKVKEELTTLAKEEGLPKSIVPSLNYLNDCGWTPYMIQAVIAVPGERATGRGRGTKLNWFLSAMRKSYSPEYIGSMANNTDRFLNFLETTREIEEIREEVFSGENPNMAYKACFDLAHSIGLARTKSLFETILSETNPKDTHLWKGIKGTYLLRELVEEAEKMGHTPEALLELRLKGNSWDASGINYDQCE
jgi:hypothetical protein